MDSFKTGAGILSVVNLVIEVSFGIYVINVLNTLKGNDSNIKTDIGAIGQKIFDIESKTVQLMNAMNEITKAMRDYKNTRNELIASVNELHQSKAVMEQRLDLVEENLDLIIQALAEKEIKVDMPKPKPVSRFARKHILVDEHKVTFGNPISTKKDIEDEDEDEDAKALKKYRQGKK